MSLLVDIGGAHGLDTQRLFTRHQDLPRDVMILQEKPEVVEMAVDLNDRIKRIPCDLFPPSTHRCCTRIFLPRGAARQAGCGWRQDL
jgi:hypothetical protein